MTEYFTKDNIDSLLDTLSQWKGTPYFHMGESKGGGVDCTKFVGLVLCELGVLSELSPRIYYAKDWPLHGKREIVFESIEEHFEKYSCGGTKYKVLSGDSEIMTGDLLCYSVCKSGLSNHTAIAVGEDMMWHCSQIVGVVKTQILPHWKKRLTRIYRLYYD